MLFPMVLDIITVYEFVRFFLLHAWVKSAIWHTKSCRYRDGVLTESW